MDTKKGYMKPIINQTHHNTTNELTLHYEILFSENMKLRERINELTGENNVLRQIVKNKELTIEELQKENEKMRTKIQELENEVKEVKWEMINLENKFTEQQKEIEILKKDNEYLKKDSEYLKKDNEHLKKDNKSLNKRLDRLVKQQMIKTFLIVLQDINNCLRIENKSEQPYIKTKLNISYIDEKNDNAGLQEFKCKYLLEKLDELMTVKDDINQRADCDNFVDELIDFIKTKVIVEYKPTKREIREIEFWWNDNL
jgi:N-terminal acetyltransferase B complex non-catalytic subunit